MRLELTKCILRPFELRDAPAIAKHWNNRNLWINLNDSFASPYTIEVAHTFLNDAVAAPESWIAIQVGGEAAGGFHITVQASPKHHSAAVGYWLGEDHWNKGIVTDALQEITEHIFATRDLTRIFAFVFEYNAASMRILEKCGYQREGWLRRSVIKDGKAIDQALYARIKNGQ